MITLHLHACTIGSNVPITLRWENFSFNVLLPGKTDLSALNGIVAMLDQQFQAHPVSSYDEGYFWINWAVSQQTGYTVTLKQPFQPITS